MSSLREKMAQHGFESNDDYSFQVHCFLQSPTKQVRALNVDGDSERRKTAFANALAQALEFKNILYHDFTQTKPVLPDVILPPSRDEMGREEPPIDPLDQIVSEACAESEGERTVLILDQLQAADFREHLRINSLICNGSWAFRDARYYANRRHLYLFLISEEPLYHALQKASFRLWVNRVCERRIDYEPADFGLGPEAKPLFQALTRLFRALDSGPTPSEFRKILVDIQLRVRTSDHLRHSLFGWAEDVDRRRLYDDALLPALGAVVDEIEAFVGAEVIAAASDPGADP